MGFLVLKAGVNRPPAEITGEVVQMVRDRTGGGEVPYFAHPDMFRSRAGRHVVPRRNAFAVRLSHF